MRRRSASVASTKRTRDSLDRDELHTQLGFQACVLERRPSGAENVDQQRAFAEQRSPMADEPNRRIIVTDLATARSSSSCGRAIRRLRRR